MPSCASRVVSVAAISAKGAPEETPRKNAASGAGSVYGRTPAGRAARQPATGLEVPVIVDRQRCVVREPRVLPDRGPPHAPAEIRADDVIVDAPPDVLRPRLAAVRPPRVLVRLGVHGAERVDVLHAAEQ